MRHAGGHAVVCACVCGSRVGSWEDFEGEYAALQHPSDFQDSKEAQDIVLQQQARLSKLLSEHMLRREKSAVANKLPPKERLILAVPMAALQKKFYRWILRRNVSAIQEGLRSKRSPSLQNVLMELKKCCNHPFLIDNVRAVAPTSDLHGLSPLVCGSHPLCRYAGLVGYSRDVVHWVPGTALREDAPA